jgi:mevalonate kinase
MGVSADKLDQLVKAARQAGATGAKLSGGGRGGNMLALPPEGAAPQIADALSAAGAKNIIITRIAG